MNNQVLPHHEMFLLCIIAVTQINSVSAIEEILNNLTRNNHKLPDFSIRLGRDGYVASSKVHSYLDNLRTKNFLDKNYCLTHSGLNLGKEGKLQVKTVIYLMNKLGVKFR